MTVTYIVLVVAGMLATMLSAVAYILGMRKGEQEAQQSNAVAFAKAKQQQLQDDARLDKDLKQRVEKRNLELVKEATKPVTNADVDAQLKEFDL
jgi:type II secretory pathway pseudopilin PulG